MTSPSVCIVGFGLIGGSFAAALKHAGHPGEIVGVVQRAESGVRALEMGLADRVSDSVADGVAGVDVVLLAVPMLAMRGLLETLLPVVSKDTIITDAGSVKRSFVDDARAVFGSLERVVPGHPIAGRESSGVEAADATLFRERKVLLTPAPETRAEAVATVSGLWEQTGATVECLTAAHHDRVLAATSHLPHVLAYALVDVLARQQESEEIFRYAAGGFRDFTRIASSDPVMWRDVCLTNRDAVIDALDDFSRSLGDLRQAVVDGDGTALESTFRRAKASRDGYVG